MSEGTTGGRQYGRGYRKRTRYDRDENEPPSIAVASALATARGEPVTGSDLRLYDYVDPDALDALFADRAEGGSRADGQVRFQVEDLTVVVRPDSVTIITDA